MSRVAVALCLLFFIFILPVPVSANELRDVLGVSTEGNGAILPPTTEGPGLILPDSPLFFLDTLKQNIRLFLAFSPEKKAVLHADIAGERLAELRFELIKNKPEAAEKALEGVTVHVKGSAEELAAAELQGRDVTALAQDLNENLKRKRDMLDVLEDSSGGEFQARVNVAQKALLESKIRIEDSLPPSQLQNEIEEDLNHEIEDQIDDANGSAENIARAIDLLEKSASDAAMKKQTKREEAIRKAIAAKNVALRNREEKGMAQDLKQLDLTRDEIEAARETIRQAREAEEKYVNAKKQSEAITDDGTSE